MLSFAISHSNCWPLPSQHNEKDAFLLDRYSVSCTLTCYLLIFITLTLPHIDLSCARDMQLFKKEETTKLTSREPLFVYAPTFSLKDPTEIPSAPTDDKPPSTPSTSTYRDSTLASLGKMRFRPLPGTNDEGEAIARLWSAAKPCCLHGEQASKLSLLQGTLARPEEGLGSPIMLHIATHGFFYSPDKQVQITTEVKAAPPTDNPFPVPLHGGRRTDPMLCSGVALAGANTYLDDKVAPETIGDGILTSYEIAQLALHQTQLVVLSACDTGLGIAMAGEGVLVSIPSLKPFPHMYIRVCGKLSYLQVLESFLSACIR